MVSMFSLEGKNAAVVGGASGIGEAVAIAFAEHGHPYFAWMLISQEH
ncbi:MAG: hypothetical protein Ct9H300mP15_14250 [Gemmatimonadota bacterium]|nr:MAG: hypothetical protein Ct9H300mP15_14250 [Gemmatimonadota bacterium]